MPFNCLRTSFQLSFRCVSWTLRCPFRLGAQIYTQTSDVECESSGLLTYDRVPKVDFKRIAAANGGDKRPAISS